MSSGCPEPAGPAQPHDAGVHSTAGLLDHLNLHAVACKAAPPPQQQQLQQQEQQPQQLQLESRPYSNPKVITPDNSGALQRSARWDSESGSLLSASSTITTNKTLPTAQGAEGNEAPLAATATSAPSAAVSSQQQQQQQQMAAPHDNPGSAPAARSQHQPSAELASTAAQVKAPSAPPEGQQHEHSALTGQQVVAEVASAAHQAGQQQHFAGTTGHPGLPAAVAAVAAQLGGDGPFGAVNQAGTAAAAPPPPPAAPPLAAPPMSGDGPFGAAGQAAGAAPMSGDGPFGAAGGAAGAAAAAPMSGDGPFGAAGGAAEPAAAAPPPPPPPPPPAAPLAAASMSGDGPFGAAGQAAGAAAAPMSGDGPFGAAGQAAGAAAAPMSGDGPFGAAGQAAGAAAAMSGDGPFGAAGQAAGAAASMSGDGPFGAAGQAAGAAAMSDDGPFGAAGGAAEPAAAAPPPPPPPPPPAAPLAAAPMSGDGPFGAAGQAAGGHQLPGLLGGLAALQQQPTGEDLEAGFEAEYAVWAQVPVFNGINTCSIGHDGDCHLLDLMASGAFGAVHQGTYFNRPVAVKILSAGLGDTLEVMQQKLQAEVGLHLRAAAFEGVVRLIAVCFSPPAIVMEQCQCSLAHRILNTWAVEQQHGQPEASWQLIMQLLADAASTLAFLHRPHQAVFHNDLRALNMLLKRTVRGELLTWELKVCDFGLSVIANSQNSMRVSPVTHHLWLAPEIQYADGGYLVNRQTDVYALGCVMEEMMTRPYHDQALTHKHRQQQQQAAFPPTAELLAALRATEPPARLRELFEQCVNVDAAMRPSAQTLARELYSLANPGPQW